MLGQKITLTVFQNEKQKKKSVCFTFVKKKNTDNSSFLEKSPKTNQLTHGVNSVIVPGSFTASGH